MLHSLTSFRFVAALMVFIFHLQFLTQFQLGSAGVQFFFVLSGFILAYNYHSKLTVLNKENIKKFYIARFAKIYPLHFLTFLIAAPLVIIYFNPDGFYFLKLAFMSGINLLLVQSFVPSQSTYFNFNGVSWTLSVEAFFYMLFPFLIWLFQKTRLGKRIALTLLGIGLVWGILFYFNYRLPEDDPFQVWLLHIFPVVRVFEFSTGVLLALIFLEKNNTVRENKTLFTWLEAAAVLFFFVMLMISTRLDVGIVRGVYFVPVWCVLIYVFAHQRGMISQWLSHKLFVFLGQISFAFYMIHQLVIRYFSYLEINTAVNAVICFSLSLALSALLYLYYEEPLRKFIRYGPNRKRTQFKPNLPHITP